MTEFQQECYKRILAFIDSHERGYTFCMDKKLYEEALPNIKLKQGDKLAIHKQFRNDVEHRRMIVSYDYIYAYANTGKYRDSSGKIHYVKD